MASRKRIQCLMPTSWIRSVQLPTVKYQTKQLLVLPKRLQRHQLAMDQLTRETDFFNFLKLLRTTDFMSKLYLKEYQRGMIPYFKKF